MCSRQSRQMQNNQQLITLTVAKMSGWKHKIMMARFIQKCHQKQSVQSFQQIFQECANFVQPNASKTEINTYFETNFSFIILQFCKFVKYVAFKHDSQNKLQQFIATDDLSQLLVKFGQFITYNSRQEFQKDLTPLSIKCDDNHSVSTKYSQRNDFQQFSSKQAHTLNFGLNKRQKNTPQSRGSMF